MMELNSPMASSDQPDTAPAVLPEIASSTITAAAAPASTLPGENMRSRYGADEAPDHGAAPVERHVLAGLLLPQRQSARSASGN